MHFYEKYIMSYLIDKNERILHTFCALKIFSITYMGLCSWMQGSRPDIIINYYSNANFRLLIDMSSAY